MSGASLAVLAAIGGGLITALSAAAISYYQRASAARDAHRLRAFERHLAAYERIFVTCRSTLDALNDYVAVDKQVSDRSDPFLYQLLEILRDCAYQYCIAVDWRHNTGMAYLEMKLEERCLRLRDLLLQWLSGPRLFYGDIATIRREGRKVSISTQAVRNLHVGDYQELIIERRTIVSSGPGDAKLIADIREAATSVIKELKDVMAY
jgi:hypothetical protein